MRKSMLASELTASTNSSAGGIEHPAHAGDVAGDPRGSLVVAGQYPLDPVPLVGAENLLVAPERHALAPIDIEHLDLVAETLRHVDPQMAELPEARGQDPVARREGVGQRRFPGSGARGWKDEYLAGSRLEDALEVMQHAR
jgi:hypothetical protein